MQFEFHPLANLFPLIEGQSFDELVADIAAHGLHEPIEILQGRILDGRNRYRALQAAGIAVDKHHLRYFRPELYGDPLAYVISKNLKRRHLNESQRAMVGARIATMRQGERTDLQPSANLPKVATPTPDPSPQGGGEAAAISQAAAAQMLNVSDRLVRSAKAVADKGAPELVAAVEQGHLAVSAAAQAVVLAPEAQRKIAQEAAAGRDNVVRTVIKQEARARREVALAEKQIALPAKKYGLILADPEWRFEPWSRETGMDRAADNHYLTSRTDIIGSRDVPSIAADDCVLFLWATAPMLPHALAVMGTWGFDYRSHCVWHKDRVGTGYWFRNRHELLLVGVKGEIPAPAMGMQADSVFIAPVGAHSAKPEAALDMIERYFPHLPKIELNRRGPARPGWDAWGNETTPYDPATGEIAVAENGSKVALGDGANRERTRPPAVTLAVSEQTAADSSDARRPSTRSEPSSGAAPQGKAPHAGTGSEMLADCDGRSEGRGVNAPATDLADDPLMLPQFLWRKELRPPIPELVMGDEGPGGEG